MAWIKLVEFSQTDLNIATSAPFDSSSAVVSFTYYLLDVLNDFFATGSWPYLSVAMAQRQAYLCLIFSYIDRAQLQW